ncbi:Putative flippase GtrA (transmembrane translocase of bactoprenol-linked glucose) [Ligilactobacillus sp. WC1T17]|uniref:Flippase GtrA (Transmembrane translocase of bactoprenol-linked glucose) n=1 Tax=Ligilactobacillus ruminis TaxID=1623 RepID=A0ABY1ABT5_9LACO|nr:Putative flippase GtrA (transmembrane translocase of bactoprenol-linked glucose) [Ligilactobacillus ruminis]
MKKIIQKHQSFIAYAFFGVLASGVNLLVFHILYQNLDFNYLIANVISYICGMLVTFFTNKKMVFHSAYDSFTKVAKEFVSFCNVRLLSFLLDNFIMVVGIEFLPLNADLLKIFDQMLVGLLNYYFSKWFIFNTTQKFEKNILHKKH